MIKRKHNWRYQRVESYIQFSWYVHDNIHIGQFFETRDHEFFRLEEVPWNESTYIHYADTHFIYNIQKKGPGKWPSVGKLLFIFEINLGKLQVNWEKNLIPSHIPEEFIPEVFKFVFEDHDVQHVIELMIN